MMLTLTMMMMFLLLSLLYFMPLNFQFFVDGHALEWGAFFKNHTCKYRLHSILGRWRRLRYGTRVLFHIVRSFQIYSISKWNQVFVRKSKRINEQHGIQTCLMHLLFFWIRNSEFIFSSPHFYHHNSIEVKIWYEIDGIVDGAKMQLMHQHNTMQHIALYEFLLFLSKNL